MAPGLRRIDTYHFGERHFPVAQVGRSTGHEVAVREERVNKTSGSLILYGGCTMTLPVRIYLSVLDGQFGTASALSTISGTPTSSSTRGVIAMATKPSLLDELRVEYEAARRLPPEHAEVEGFQQIDARLRKAFRWLEKAVAYLDGLKPPINHRFDLGHGMVFDTPRFGRGFVGQHERRIVGYPVLDEINIHYVVTAAKPLAIDVAPGGIALAEKSLDGAGLQYTNHCTEDSSGAVRKCLISVPPEIPAAVAFRADYQTGLVAAALTNVDRLERVTLEFHSNAIEEPVLEDLIRLMLGRDSAFLRRAPLAGIHGKPTA